MGDWLLNRMLAPERPGGDSTQGVGGRYDERGRDCGFFLFQRPCAQSNQCPLIHLIRDGRILLSTLFSVSQICARPEELVRQFCKAMARRGRHLSLPLSA